MAISILPDPNNLIDDTGASGTGTAGPGYAEVQIKSNQPFMKNRTNSGRISTRAVVGQHWGMQLSYNPLTRAQFDIIFAYLMSKRGGLVPFFVSLPQYIKAAMVANPTVSGAHNAGVSTVAYSGGTVTPSKGDLFTIEDATDSAHTKAYMVTSLTGGLLSISPPLSKDTATNAVLNFNNPLLRVIVSSDINEYSLNTEGLYSFSLTLEEAQV